MNAACCHANCQAHSMFLRVSSSRAIVVSRGRINGPPLLKFGLVPQPKIPIFCQIVLFFVRGCVARTWVCRHKSTMCRHVSPYFSAPRGLNSTLPGAGRTLRGCSSLAAQRQGGCVATADLPSIEPQQRHSPLWPGGSCSKFRRGESA